MNILLTGAAGQLGQELLPLLQEMGAVTCVDRSFEGSTLPFQMSQDLSDLNRVEIMLNRVRPDLVVNACAYTAVDAAESETELAFRLNGDLPGCLAKWVQRYGGLLAHYSTDYVFDGDTSDSYFEEDKPAPLNVYGESKLAGEWAIQASSCRHLILRTSWVYSGHGNNFVLSMLRLANSRPSLQIVNDQTGCPTWARNLAQVSQTLIEHLRKNKSDSSLDGLYHYSDSTIVTWYEFALSIFTIAEQMGLLQQVPETSPIDSNGYPQAAQRPKHSVLDTGRIRKVFGVEPAQLKDSLNLCLQELKNIE